MALALLLLTLGIGVTAVWAVWPREPSYQGRSLSAWLDALSGEGGEHLQAEEVVRHLGAKAVPFLKTRLTLADDPSWRLNLIEFADQQSLIKIRFVPASVRRFQALVACDALGPMAKDALPTLEKLLYEYPYNLDAALVMADIGPEAIASLSKGLTNNVVLISSCCRTAVEIARSTSQTKRDADFQTRLIGFPLKAAPMMDYGPPASPAREF
jgi:hypothetical protein